MRRDVPRRNDLQNAKAVLTVGDERERAAGDHADLDVVGVVDGSVRGVLLVEARLFGIFDVDDGHAGFALRHIRVSARHINVSRILERDSALLLEPRVRQVGHVQGLQSRAVHYKCVTELNCDAAWIVEIWSADGCRDAGGERIIEVDDNQGLVGEDVSISSGDGDSMRAAQDAVGIEGQRALQEIVGRIAVEERTYAGAFGFQIGIANDDEAFLRVGYVKKAVEQMDGLLFVFAELLTQRIDTQSRWRGDGQGVFRWNEKALADGRDRCGGDALGETFVVDVGDVVDAEAAVAGGGVRVFAAGLDVEDVAFVVDCGGEFAMMGLEFLVVVGVGDALQVAAVDGFGFVVFRDGDRFKTFLAGGDVNIAAH